LDLENNVTAFDRFVVLLKALRRSHLFFNSYPLVLLIDS
jgi:sRNA-binding regulator protein Hfq